jgi:hypothetical protein
MVIQQDELNHPDYFDDGIPEDVLNDLNDIENNVDISNIN